MRRDGIIRHPILNFTEARPELPRAVPPEILDGGVERDRQREAPYPRPQVGRGHDGCNSFSEPLFHRAFRKVVLGGFDASDSGVGAFFRMFRDLQDLHSFAPLRIENCIKNLPFFLRIFTEIS